MYKESVIVGFLFFFLLVFSACTLDKDVSQINEKSRGNSDEVIELDWYVDLSWWDKLSQDGQDVFSQTLQKDLGIKLNIITPETDGAQQLDTMITSKNLPDIISVESWLGYQTRMAKAGLIYDMNTLINQYAPEFNNTLKKDVFEWYEEADGKTYGFPNYAYSIYDLKEQEKLEPNACFILRSDMYEAIGRPEFSSYPEFLKVLAQVQEAFPTINGKEVVALQLYEFLDVGNISIDTWLPEYFAVPFENSQGEFLNTRRQAEYYEVLQFVSQAYRQGAIRHENFVESREQINQKIIEGQVFAMLVAPQDFESQIKALYKRNPNYVYEAFVVRNAQKDEPMLRDMSGYGWLFTMISKNCEHPDKAIQLLEFLASDEGQMLAYFGQEGLTYELKGNKAVWTQEYHEAVKTDEVEKRFGTGFDLMINWLFVKEYISEPKEAVEKYYQAIKSPVVDYSIDRRATDLKIDRRDPQAFEIYEIDKRVNLYWGSVLPKLIMAENESDLAETYQEAIEAMDDLGMKKLDDFYRSAYEKEKIFYQQEQ